MSNSLLDNSLEIRRVIMLEKEISVNRSTWPQDLELQIASEDLKSLLITDKEAIFDGMCEVFSRKSGIEIDEASGKSKEKIGASAPLLIPRTRIFIRFEQALEDWAKRLIKTAVMFAIVGTINPVYAFAGLSVDFVIAILGRLSKLDEAEAVLVNTILELSKSKEGRLPSMSDIAKEMKVPIKDVKKRLVSLESRGIIRQRKEGCQVTF